MNVSLSGANIFNANRSGGLWATSEGSISLSSVTASNNQIGAGVYLYNEIPGSTGGITLSGVNTFNNNDGSGLDASTLGRSPSTA